MATSTVAGGKVGAAHTLGKPIPDHWVVDSQGRPTTTPGDFFAGGALTPMAGHKGYGLALLIESLSGLLTGALITHQVLRWMVDDPSLPTGHGAAFLAFNVGAMTPIDAFKRRVDELVDEIHLAPRQEGVDRVYLPGEMEWDCLARAEVDGVELPADVLASLRGLADEMDLETRSWFAETV
jgi:LDH2 family malate/lactate/ureidoglycolate dehydrogenase